jgi:hypothetical protein
MVYEIRAQVDFLDVLRELPLIDRSDDWTTAMERVRKLKFVDDAWIDHTCLISISTETSNALVAERRIKDVITKATNILASYKAVPR